MRQTETGRQADSAATAGATNIHATTANAVATAAATAAIAATAVTATAVRLLFWFVRPYQHAWVYVESGSTRNELDQAMSDMCRLHPKPEAPVCKLCNGPGRRSPAWRTEREREREKRKYVRGWLAM